MKDYRNYRSKMDKLTKDPSHAKISGVCAGMARHYGLPRLGVRIGMLAMFFMFPVVIAVGYLLAVMLLDDKCW